jgi:hypothetical protein
LLKFSSNFLRDQKYNVKGLSLQQARINNQVIRQGESELIRKVLRIEKSEFTPDKLQEILEMKGRILGKRDEKGNRKILQELETQIDNLLFIPDLVSIKFDDPRHYRHVAEKGLKINGKSFVRLLCGAGMARASTVLFCSEGVFEELWDFINCGRFESIKINPNKFSAYSGLASSASHRVSTPIFCVVPDLVIKRTLQCDYITESPIGKDSIVEPKEIEIESNIFDGQGLISVAKANDWVDELEIGYTPAAFIFRGPFLKGLLLVFDIYRIAEENGVNEIVDVYGQSHHIEDIDCIISQSQFKMMDGYSSIEQFRQEAKKRDFGWSITRVNAQRDKDTVTTTYQYLQAVRLEQNDIVNVCKETVDWLSSVKQDSRWALLFLLGELTKEKVSSDWFSKFSDPIVKSILLNPECINDPHVFGYIQRLIRKVETEAKMGTLRVAGNYSFLAVDPVAQMEHALGLPVKGIIKSGYIYSNYWNKKGVGEITVLRSPTTWRSEVLKTKLQNDDVTNDYFLSSYSNLVFNIYDNYLLQLSSADADGDIALSTPFLNKYVYREYRIPSYDRKTAEKKEIDKRKLYESDLMSFGSKVGLLTNAGTCLFGMLSIYEKDSIEYNTIVNRLKIANTQQNMIIDSAKGIHIQPFPRWWLDRLTDKGKENLSFNEIQLYEKLRIQSRPYFMRYVYPTTHGKEYRKYQETYENISNVRFGISLKQLLEKQNKSENEEKVFSDYYKYSPLLDNLSPMNLLSHHMENEIDGIKKKLKTRPFDYRVYIDDDILVDVNKLQKMKELYLEFSSSKRNSHDGRMNKEEKEENLIVFKKKIYGISSNLAELTNLLVHVLYVIFPKRSKDMLWKLLPNGILLNLNRNNITRSIELIVEDPDGEIDYLNKKYSTYDLEI